MKEIAIAIAFVGASLRHPFLWLRPSQCTSPLNP